MSSARSTLTRRSASRVLDALGDESRRAILEHLATGPKPVGELADRLPISRPAVSQHLKVLKEAKLVLSETAGTRHLYRVDPTGFEVAKAYLDQFWSKALKNFKAIAEADVER